MSTLMRVDPKFRQAAKEYQDSYKRKHKLTQAQVNKILPLTKVTRYFGEYKISFPDIFDIKKLKWRYANQK